MLADFRFRIDDLLEAEGEKTAGAFGTVAEGRVLGTRVRVFKRLLLAERLPNCVLGAMIF